VSVEHARAAKEARARALHGLQNGTASLRSLLVVGRRHSWFPPLENTEVYDVCMATRGLGASGCRQLFERASVWPHIVMSELTPAQREALVRELPARVS
jgi:hypothetical protein